MPDRHASSIPAAPRSGALDALRFLAAVFIVLYHFGPNAPVDLAAEAPIFARGWIATNFFLILSGYVLGRAYGRALDAGALKPLGFFARRLTRVWPAQVLVLGGLIVLVAAAAVIGIAPGSPERFRLGELLAQVSLTQAWGVTRQAGWNEPSWTLSALVVCYALFPLIWRASRPLAGRTAALGLGVVLLMGAAVASLEWLGHSLFDLPFHQGVLRALPFFGLGLMLARFADGRRQSRAWSVASGLAALGALVVLQAAPRTEASAFVSILAIALVVVSADGLKLASTPRLKAAADLSFALFITHALVGAAWFGLSRALGVDHSWIVWSAGCGAALAFAAVFDRLVDQSIQRRLKTLMARPRPTGPAEALPA